MKQLPQADGSSARSTADTVRTAGGFRSNKTAGATSDSASTHPSPTPIRGVNLGNWLVLEKWMEPALFEGYRAEDEDTLATVAPKDQLAQRIRHHRDTYITERDFREIAACGMNLVRLPVPYTVFESEPPLGGAWRYVDKAMRWARAYHLRVLLDLHTAPGGQNGFDSSGLIGAVTWHKKPQNVEKAITVLEGLAHRYGHDPALFGIEVINEPVSWPVFFSNRKKLVARNPKDKRYSSYVPMSFLRQYYRATYKRLRRYLPDDKAIVFHDGFRFGLWRDFFKRNQMTNVYVDAHVYLSAAERIARVHSPWAYRLFLRWQRRRIRSMQRVVPVLVGEWCVENEWAKNLDPEEMNLDQFDDAQRRRFAHVTRMQLSCFEQAAGWMYWSWKLEPSPHTAPDALWKECWDFRRCLMHGWLPDIAAQDDGR